MSERQITKDMLEDVEWLNQQLQTMNGAGYDRQATAEYLGRTEEFIKGVLWERARRKEAAAQEWMHSWVFGP